MYKQRALVAALIALLAVAPAYAAAPLGATDDWTTQDHDVQRMGFEPLDTGITPKNVSDLTLRWAISLKEPVYGSPLVAGGRIYVATGKGNMYALSVVDGRTLWKTVVGDSIHMTPAIADGKVFVGNYGIPTMGADSHMHPVNPNFAALDLKTGKILWKVPAPGLIRAEPVIVNGIVYEGIAGGDIWNGCVPGRIAEFDEQTGKLLKQTWLTSPKPQNGGGLFGPLSYDGTNFYVGTGDTCDLTGAQESAVAVTKDMKTHWVTSGQKSLTPDQAKFVEETGGQDVGSSVTIHGNVAYAKGKSGFLFAMDKNTGKKIWEHNVAPNGVVGSGGIGSITGDGSMVMVNNGQTPYDKDNNPKGTTSFVAFDLAGNEKYYLQAKSAINVATSAVFVPGVGFLPIDSSVVAFNSQTGEKLWSYPTKDEFYTSLAVVPSGLYAVDLSGNVYAFSLPGVAPVIASATNVQQLAQLPNLIKDNSPHWKRILFGAIGGFGFIIVGLGAFLIRRNKAVKATVPESTNT